MPDPCDLPGNPICVAGDVVGGVIGNAAGTAADGIFDAAARKLAEGFAAATEFVVTFWTDVAAPELTTDAGPVAELRANTHWLTGAVAAFSLLVAAGQMAFTRSGRPAQQAFGGLLRLVLLTAVAVPTVSALVAFFDGYSDWVLDRATDGGLGERMASLSLAGTNPGLPPGLVLILALVGMLASLTQLALMLVRVGVITIFAGVLPLIAAASGTETGNEWLKRSLSWLLAYVLYKPAAATIYAAAFLLFGDGTDAVSVLSGFFLLVLSVAALPALLRLLTPAVGSAVSAAQSSGLTAAGLVVATGAKSVASGSRAGAAAASGPVGVAIAAPRPRPTSARRCGQRPRRRCGHDRGRAAAAHLRQLAAAEHPGPAGSGDAGHGDRLGRAAGDAAGDHGPGAAARRGVSGGGAGHGGAAGVPRPCGPQRLARG